MSKLIEEWKPVVGFEGLYEISDWGNVRSVDRIVESKNKYGVCKWHFKGKKLSIAKDKYGYSVVALGKYHPNKKVHRLVAEAFIPNPENKPVVGHNDCNPSNNCVWNLYWCTVYENVNHPITKERMRKNAKKQYLKRERNKLGQFK